MNVRTRISISLLLLALTLALGIMLARQPTFISLAGEDQPPYEFVAPIVAIPNGSVGIWQVGQTEVEVTSKTAIDTTAGPARPGAWAWIKAVSNQGILRALAVRILAQDEVPPYVDVHGIVRKVYGDTWIISGRQVRVHPGTRILGNRSPQGSVATVRGHMEGTTLVADIIMLSSPAEEANRVEFLGRLEEVKGTTWVVDGIEIEVPQTVKAPPIGTLVGVRGQVKDTSRVQAEELMVQQAPNTFLEGWLIDASADKRVWRILTSEQGKNTGREVQVSLSANVPVDERVGLARVGARVEVIGTSLDGNAVEASFVRVLEARQAYFTGVLVYIPEDPYAFPWTIEKASPQSEGTIRVWVRSTTVFDRPISEFRLGDRVAVSGARGDDGTIIARMISHSKR